MNKGIIVAKFMDAKTGQWYYVIRGPENLAEEFDEIDCEDFGEEDFEKKGFDPQNYHFSS